MAIMTIFFVKFIFHVNKKISTFLILCLLLGSSLLNFSFVNICIKYPLFFIIQVLLPILPISIMAIFFRKCFNIDKNFINLVFFEILFCIINCSFVPLMYLLIDFVCYFSIFFDMILGAIAYNIFL